MGCAPAAMALIPAFPALALGPNEIVAAIDMMMLPLARSDGSGATVVLRTSANEGPAIVSPESRWGVYVSSQTGRPEVFARPCPEGDGQWQISFEGLSEPRWSRDGREIFRGNGTRALFDDQFRSQAPPPITTSRLTARGSSC
jgi:hypothetical protein